ncbi:MAG TPA: PAS domain S-box protein [Burkholderiales bacterium]|nr:PAS domain S-box protein [Burkholderiales bacterium]
MQVLGHVNGLSQEAIEALPVAVYMTDADGRVTFYNEAAAELWGCRPELGESRFCGSWKLYWPDGTPLPHEECPMALSLRQRLPIHGMEAVAERPDGTRVPFIPYPTPLFDESGKLSGAVNMLVDISDRKRAEAALAERKAQLAVFVEHAPAGIAMFDCEMRFLAVSRRLVVDHRLPQDAQLIGRSVYEVFPRLPKRWCDIHARVLAGEKLSQEEDPFTHEDGRTDWMRWSMVPWRRADGNIGGALLFAELRTEQVEARRALADSEARFRATFESAAVGIALVGRNGSILRANDSFVRMLGYSAEELRTKTFQELTYPDDLALNLTVLKKALVGETDTYCIEKRYVRKDGGVVWASLSVGCVRKPDGRVDYFISVIEDITDRKHAEARLAERNAQLGLAGRAARVGSFVVDYATERIQTSPGFAAIHGLADETEEFTCEEWLGLVLPADLARFEALRNRVFAERRRELNIDYRVVGTDGEPRWIESRGLVSYGGDGRPTRLVGVHIDITERKRAEDRLQESERKLREILGALPAAIYMTDAEGHITYCNQGAVDLWGLEPVLGRDKWSDLGKFYHADGSPMDLAHCPTEVALRQGVITRGQEAIIERKDGVRIPIAPYPTPLRDETGRIVSVVNMTVDISERKKAERTLAERNLQLALAGKAALVGSYAYDVGSDVMQVEEGYAALHGLPDGTRSTTRDELRARVHQEDLARVEMGLSQAFASGRSEYGFEYRIVRPDGEVRWIESRSFVSSNSDGRQKRVVGVNIDITDRKLAEEHLRMMVAELDHRVKNVLATVSALTSCTQDASGSVADFVATLDGRIRSMAATHQLLSCQQWKGILLSDLARRELAPYATGNNTEIDGPNIILKAEAAQAVSMVFHELATNAAKHGALSTPGGRVAVRWYRLQNSDADALRVEWQEVGGPVVKAPRRCSYGTEIIRGLLPYELDGKVDLAFAAAGVRCRFDVPLSQLTGCDRLARTPREPLTNGQG